MASTFLSSVFSERLAKAPAISAAPRRNPALQTECVILTANLVSDWPYRTGIVPSVANVIYQPGANILHPALH
jgi:hypothetical protein